MKRLTPRFRRWLVHRQNKEAWRHSGQKYSVATLSTGAGRQLVRAVAAGRLPSTLCIDRNLSTSLSFFHDLRVRTIRPVRGTVKGPTSKHRGGIGWVRSYWDFVSLRDVSPGAALILAAEFDRINRFTKSGPRAIDIHQWDNQVYATLYHLGFFELLGFSEEQMKKGDVLPPPAMSEYVIMPMTSGSDVDMSEAGDAIVALFEKVGGSHELRFQLMSAVIDAVENVRSHAYAERGRADFRLIPPRWWLSGAASPAERKLSLSIYDQGVSIPVRLPKVWSPSILSALFQRVFGSDFRADAEDRDGETIAAAMKISATSTGMENRGKGLPKIRDIVQACGGSLRILSRNGDYRFASAEESWRSNHLPLLGTYVEIKVTF